jgi:hypothetical protein
MLDGPHKEDKAMGEDPSLQGRSKGKLRPHELSSATEHEQAPRCAMGFGRRFCVALRLPKLFRCPKQRFGGGHN